VAVGLALGSSLAWYLSETARAFLFGIAPTDPRAFGIAAISLLAAASVATIVPAWRAASVDPVLALRAE
jgi:putative ABC transport system permease protein